MLSTAFPHPPPNKCIKIYTHISPSPSHIHKHIQAYIHILTHTQKFTPTPIRQGSISPLRLVLRAAFQEIDEVLDKSVLVAVNTMCPVVLRISLVNKEQVNHAEATLPALEDNGRNEDLDRNLNPIQAD